MATELVSSYISLSVKYADAQKQIASDLLGLQDVAKRAGANAGEALHASMTKAAKFDGSDAKRSFTGFETAAKGSGKKAGTELAEGVLSGARSEFSSGSRKLTAGLTDQFSGAGEEAGSSLVDGLGSKVAVLGRAAGPIGLALAGAVGLGAVIGAKLGQELLSGFDRETQRNTVQVQLGLDESGAKRVQQAVTDAYKNNFGASVEDLNQTANAVIQNGLASATDQSGIQKMIESVETVATVTGETTDAISRSASVLVDSGLVKDFPEALDVIAAGQQKGLNVSEDWLDTLTEYGVQFAKLGIDGPVAIGAINQLMEGGARSTDLAADAFKEFSIRAIDDSESTRTAYDALGLDADQMMQRIARGGPDALAATDEVVDALNAIEDPVRRNTNGVALFGTQWEDLGEATRNLDLSAAGSQIGDVAGAVQNASDILGSGGLSGFESLGRQMETLRWQFQDFLAESFGPTMNEVASWVQNHQGEIIGFFAKLGDIALVTGEFVVKGVGHIAHALGEIIAPIGDAIGFATKAHAALQRLTGDTETADRLDAEAEGYFAWGEGLKSFGDAAVGLSFDGPRDAMADYAAKAANAADNTQLLKTGIETLPNGEIVLKDNSPEAIQRVKDLGYAVQELPDGKIAIKVEYKDDQGRIIPSNQLGISQRQQSDASGKEGRPGFARGSNGIVTGPGSGTSDSILAWLSNGEGVVTAKGMANGGAALVAALNAGWTPGADYLHKMIPGFAEGLNPGADFLRKQIMQLWPQIGTIGGRRSEDGYGEHSSGNAIDVMIPGYDTPEGKALGDAVASWVVTNKEALGLDGMIWRQTSFGYGGSWSGKEMGDRGSDTQNHMDHLHLILGEGRGEGAPAVDLPSMSLSSPSGGGSIYAGGGSSAGGGGSKATAKQVSAQQDKITDLEDRLSTSELALSEAESKGGASESSLKSKRDAIAKNKRELDQAKADLADMQNGTGDYAGDGTSLDMSTGSDSDNPFAQIAKGVGQLTDLAKGGLKETFLPPGFSDPEEWGITKTAGALLGFGGGLAKSFSNKLLSEDPNSELGQGLGMFGSILGAGGQIAGGSTGDGVGSLIGLLGEENTWAPADLAVQDHAGTGDLPGPANYVPDPAANGGTTNVDNSVHVAEGGQINQNATQILDKTQRQQTANQRPHLGTRRFI